MSEPLLHTRISVDYPNRPRVLDGVELEVREGEIAGLVGESGSGKSTFALSVLGLLGRKNARVRGHIFYRGQDLLAYGESQMRRIRGRKIGVVLQSASSSLNPRLRLGTHLREAWLAHGSKSWQQAKPYVIELLEELELPASGEFLRRFPGQVSVGQAQRILIAMAVMHRPALLIADEPTSALDMVTRAEVLRLFARLNRQWNMAILYISHDLLSVSSLCQRVSILKEGQIVESASCHRIFQQPAHAYTRALIGSLPRMDICMA
jgi:ABC-type dipeptide/oligopeptide/nickel transport system ATPase component